MFLGVVFVVVVIDLTFNVDGKDPENIPYYIEESDEQKLKQLKMLARRWRYKMIKESLEITALPKDDELRKEVKMLLEADIQQSNVGAGVEQSAIENDKQVLNEGGSIDYKDDHYKQI